MEVDQKEYNKQKREEMINLGEYVEICIIVSEKEETPLVYCDMRGIGTEELATAIHCMKDTLEILKKTYPEAYEYSKYISSKKKVIETKYENEE